MDDHLFPAEAVCRQELESHTRAGMRWSPLRIVEELKAKAQDVRLWNLFLPVASPATRWLGPRSR